MKKSSIILLFIFSAILVLLIIFVGPRKNSQIYVDGQNVHMENGVQVVEIKAGGGYAPARSVAKAGIPTVLRFTTNGAFDCSSSIRIPSMSLTKILPQTGTEDIDLGVSKSGPLQGMCGMGMYPFSIEFQ